MDCRVVDVTLRDGLQAPSAALSIYDRIELGKRIANFGVDVIQAGFAGRDEAVADALVRDSPAHINLLVLGFGDDVAAALRGAAKAGVQSVEVLLRSGRRQLEAMGISPSVAIRAVERVVFQASEMIDEVWFCPSFATQSDPATLHEMIDAAVHAGARHINLPDSAGVASPEDVAGLVQLVRGWQPTAVLGIHTHNDYGLALANALAGLEAGAEFIDATVLGFGERAGNCSLEQVTVALKNLYDAPLELRWEVLTDLAHFLGEKARRPIPFDAPVVGRDAFAQELDAHVRLTKSDPSLLEPFDPSTVGNRRRLAVGVGSGLFALSEKLSEVGFDRVPEQQLSDLLSLVHRRAIEVGEISDLEFTELAHALYGPR